MFQDDIIKLAEIGIVKQNANGSMPCGKNGPHNHAMTPVRNTAHWAITFGAAFYITQDLKFRRAAESALSIVKLFSTSDGRFSFHRFPRSGTVGNGLIGQMWVVECYLMNSFFLGDENLKTLAKSILDAHNFSYKDALWLDNKQQNLSTLPNNTLNQQIWVAGMHGLYSFFAKEEMNTDMVCFLKAFFKNLTSESAPFPLEVQQLSFVSKCKYSLYKLKSVLSASPKVNSSLVEQKMYGYHSFCLVGLGYTLLSGYKLTAEESSKLALRFTLVNELYEQKVKSSPFGSSYNLCGIELKFFSDFVERELSVKTVINRLVKNEIASLFNGKNIHKNIDLETLQARGYELSRFLILHTDAEK